MTLLGDLLSASACLRAGDRSGAELAIRLATDGALLLADDCARRLHDLGVGAGEIQRERLRHVAKGWDSAHDLQHSADELAYAALFQLDAVLDLDAVSSGEEPPLKSAKFAEKARRRDKRAALVVAGSMCAAAIDRLDVELAAAASGSAQTKGVPDGTAR
ncbi:MAG: hypothetical protein AAGN46_05535 [Acidobacteriota bacterium]